MLPATSEEQDQHHQPTTIPATVIRYTPTFVDIVDEKPMIRAKMRHEYNVVAKEEEIPPSPTHTNNQDADIMHADTSDATSDEPIAKRQKLHGIDYSPPCLNLPNALDTLSENITKTDKGLVNGATTAAKRKHDAMAGTSELAVTTGLNNNNSNNSKPTIAIRKSINKAEARKEEEAEEFTLRTVVLDIKNRTNQNAVETQRKFPQRHIRRGLRKLKLTNGDWVQVKLDDRKLHLENRPCELMISTKPLSRRGRPQVHGREQQSTRDRWLRYEQRVNKSRANTFMQQRALEYTCVHLNHDTPELFRLLEGSKSRMSEGYVAETNKQQKVIEECLASKDDKFRTVFTGRVKALENGALESDVEFLHTPSPPSPSPEEVEEQQRQQQPQPIVQQSVSQDVFSFLQEQQQHVPVVGQHTTPLAAQMLGATSLALPSQQQQQQQYSLPIQHQWNNNKINNTQLGHFNNIGLQHVLPSWQQQQQQFALQQQQQFQMFQQAQHYQQQQLAKQSYDAAVAAAAALGLTSTVPSPAPTPNLTALIPWIVGGTPSPQQLQRFPSPFASLLGQSASVISGGVRTNTTGSL